MKRTILLSQNGWEYTGKLEIEADTVKVLPNINEFGFGGKNILLVNGAKLTFDDEIAPVCHGKEMEFINNQNDWVCSECCKWQGEE